MNEIKKIIEEKGKPFTVYYDNDGNVFFSYQDKYGMEYLTDLPVTKLEIKSDAHDFEKRCENLLNENDVDSLLLPINAYYDNFLNNYYSGEENILFMDDEEQKSLFDEIKRCERKVKENPSDKEIILDSIKLCEYALIFADNKLKKDKDFAMEVAKTSPFGISLLNPEYLNDKSIALTAVKTNALSLSIFSEDIKNDLDIALNALKNDSRAYEFLGEKLKNDKAFLDKLKKENIDLY